MTPEPDQVFPVINDPDELARHMVGEWHDNPYDEIDPHDPAEHDAEHDDPNLHLGHVHAAHADQGARR